MEQVTSSHRRNRSDLLSLLALIPALVALATGQYLLGAALWLVASLFAFWIAPANNQSVWWGTIFGIPVLFAGTAANLVILALLYLLAPIILLCSLVRERWRIHKMGQLTCTACGTAFGKSKVKSSVDLAYQHAFEAVDDPMDEKVDYITLVCPTCKQETKLPW